MKDKRDNATRELPGMEAAVPAAAAQSLAAPRRARSSARPQEQLSFLEDTDSTGLPVWQRDPARDDSGLPIWPAA